MYASIIFPAGKIKMTRLSLVAFLTTLVLTIAMTGCDDSPTDADLNGDNNGNGDSPEEEVQMVGQSFDPDNFEVTEGTTVVWTNESDLTHTVTSGADREHDGLFDSGNVAPGEEFSYTFDEVGTYDYYCIPHTGMNGVIEVVE